MASAKASRPKPVGPVGLILFAASVLAVPFPVNAQTFVERFERIKAEASQRELYALLWDLPKGGDLHNHLGGTGSPATWFDVASDPERNGGQLYYTRTRIENCGACPENLLMFHMLRADQLGELGECCRREYRALGELSVSEKAQWLSSFKIDRPGEGRNEFFERIWSRNGAMTSETAVLEEILVNNMKRFAAEKVRYVEWQSGVLGKTHLGRPLSPDDFASRLRARLEREDAIATGVVVRFQANVLRFHRDAEQMVERSYAFVVDNRTDWVGINLVGREDNDKGYPLRFLETFRRLRRRFHGVELSIHGGEVDEPNRHVRDTLLLGASRIGHAVNLITDPDTLLLMRTGSFLIENSLVSNHLLEYSDPKQHPFVEYLRLGIPVALATDDRGMWESNMTDEYMRAVVDFNLSWDEIQTITRDSLKHAFLDEPIKRRLLDDLNRELAAFAVTYSGDDWRERLENVRPQVSGYAETHFFAKEQ